MPDSDAPDTRPRAGTFLDRPLAPALFVALLFAATLLVFWNGVGPGDSDKYVRAAVDWLENGPVLGKDHWALRLPLVLPLAASYALFGRGEFVSTLPNILYAAGLVAITFVFVRKHLGKIEGFAAAALVATSSYFVTLQSEIWITGVDAFFIALSGWLFIDALAGNRERGRFLAAGLCAGLAWLCRETAIFLPMTFGLVLLTRRPLRFDALVAVGAGFTIVVLAELAAYWIIAGDPLYRIWTDFGHRGDGNFYRIDGVSETFLERLWAPVPLLVSAPPALPFVALSAAAWMVPGFRRAMAERRDVVVFFGLASALGFLVAVFAANLRSPAYYPIVIYAALLSLGAFTAHIARTGGRNAASAVLAGLVALNALTADFRTFDEYTEPRQLAHYLVRNKMTVTTDQATAVRTRMFLIMDGLDRETARDLVRSDLDFPPPFCGLVYAATPAGSKRAIAPEPEWREAWRAKGRERRWTHRLLGALGFDEDTDTRLGQIAAGAPPAALYEAPPCKDQP